MLLKYLSGAVGNFLGPGKNLIFACIFLVQNTGQTLWNANTVNKVKVHIRVDMHTDTRVNGHYCIIIFFIVMTGDARMM
jgi:hypothetical protein